MQFDVFNNPVARSRRILPYVAILQSDLVPKEHDCVVAFIAQRTAFLSFGRVAPEVEVLGKKYLLLLRSVTNLPTSDLRSEIDNIARHRDEIVRGIDWLFLGV